MSLAIQGASKLRESWEPYVDLSIVHFMIYPETMGGAGPILETVSRILSDDFFSMIELAHIGDVAIRKQVAEQIETAHARVAFGAQPAILSQKLDLNSHDVSKRKEAIEKLLPLIDEAREIGAKRFTVLSGPDPGEGKRKKAAKLLVDSLITLCSYAKEKGVSVTLETFDRTIEKRNLIGPSDEALVVAQAVKTLDTSLQLPKRYLQL